MPMLPTDAKEETLRLRTKSCSKCLQEKPLDEFYADPKHSDGRRADCRECFLSRQKAYSASPDGQETRRQYGQRPEVQERKAARAKSPEHKEYQREYKQTEKYQEQQKEYRRRPEVKEANLAYHREYDKRPEVAERNKNKRQTPKYKERRKNYGQRLEVKEKDNQRNKTPERLRQRRENSHLHPERVLFNLAKSRAKTFNVPFSLNESDLHVPEKCPIFDITLEKSRGYVSEGSPSVDRVIPELGYTRDNVQIISHRANVIKNNGSAEEHRRIANWMTDWGRTPRPDAERASDEYDSLKKIMIKSAKRRAKKRGIVFGISKQDICIPEVCPVLGIPIAPNKSRLRDSSPTLDRADVRLGYEKGNIAVISHRANKLKNDGTAREHIQIAEYIEKHLNNVNEEELVCQK